MASSSISTAISIKLARHSSASLFQLGTDFALFPARARSSPGPETHSFMVDQIDSLQGSVSAPMGFGSVQSCTVPVL